MQSIKHVSEHVETTEGEALGSRNYALRVLQSRVGLGPPDLMWLRKSALSPITGAEINGDNIHTGFYHWILGQDVSSAATIAAYFAQLRENVEKPGFLQGFMASEEYKVVAGTYCSYDAFSGLDLRCELAVPGGVSVEARAGSGASVPVTEGVWIGAWVSGFLRSEILDLQTLAGLGAIRRVEPVPSLAAEEQLLKCVERVYQDEGLRQRVPMLHEDQGRGVKAEDWDVLCAVIYHHFRRRQRLEQACDFFSGLVEWHPEAAIYASMAEHDLDMFDEALKTLEGAVKKFGQSPALKVALGERLLEIGQIKRAVSLAQGALELDRNARCAWMLLARGYSAGEAYPLVLIALNLTPAPLDFPNSKSVLGSVPPPPYDTTVPQAKLHDPELEELSRHREEAEVDGNDDLLDLPAAVLLPLEPMGSGQHLNITQHRAALCVFAAVFGILTDIVDAIGWEGFLEERASVFLMNDELASSSSSFRDSSCDGTGSDHSGDPQPLYPLPGAPVSNSELPVSVGRRTPPPPGLVPAAAPPPSSGPQRSPMAAMEAASSYASYAEAQLLLSPLSENGVNPSLWATIFGTRGSRQPQVGSAPEVTANSFQQLSISEDVEESEWTPQALYSVPESSLQPSRSTTSNDQGEGGLRDDASSEDAGSDGDEDDDDFSKESDREWMIRGDVAALLDNKRLCTGWVDELIQALYKDLAEYMSWILLDRRIRRAERRHLEPEPGDASGSDEEDEVVDDIPVPVLLPVDWMRRGLLCQRLGKEVDAERALRVAVHDGFNMTAYQALGRIYAVQGLVPEGVNVIVEILAHHERIQKFDQHMRIPSSIVWIFCTLVMVGGLQQVRTAFRLAATADKKVSEKAIYTLMDDALHWQTDGFDT